MFKLRTRSARHSSVPYRDAGDQLRLLPDFLPEHLKLTELQQRGQAQDVLDDRLLHL